MVFRYFGNDLAYLNDDEICRGDGLNTLMLSPSLSKEVTLTKDEVIERDFNGWKVLLLVEGKFKETDSILY